LYEAQRIVNEEGFRAFWKGNLVTIAHRLPYTAVNFYTYECYKNVSFYALYMMCVVQNLLLVFLIFESILCHFVLFQLLHSLLGENHRAKASSDVFVHFVSGGLSGMTAAAALYPLDLVRTRLAAQVIATFLLIFFYYYFKALNCLS
jgi:solute carrier family 25 phosphate transporter 23/24/25/41